MQALKYAAEILTALAIIAKAVVELAKLFINRSTSQ